MIHEWEKSIPLPDTIKPLLTADPGDSLQIVASPALIVTLLTRLQYCTMAGFWGSALWINGRTGMKSEWEQMLSIIWLHFTFYFQVWVITVCSLCGSKSAFVLCRDNASLISDCFWRRQALVQWFTDVRGKTETTVCVWWYWDNLGNGV